MELCLRGALSCCQLGVRWNYNGKTFTPVFPTWSIVIVLSQALPCHIHSCKQPSEMTTGDPCVLAFMPVSPLLLSTGEKGLLTLKE